MIEKFEEKVNDIKRKINKKYFGIFLFMIFGILVIFASNMTNSYKIEKQALQDEYNKYMYQIVGYVNNVEIELEKLTLTNTNNLKITTLADILRLSNLAKSNLESLPVTQDSMQMAAKYLNQVSDYSYMLMKNIVNGGSITAEEQENITKLYNNSKEFSKVLSDIYKDLNSGRIKWDELSKIGDEKLKEDEISEEVLNIDKINKTFQEYEGLIYDGAFSEHILTMEPKYLSKNAVSEEVASNTIYNIFKDKVESVEYLGEISGRIDLYSYNVKLIAEENIRNVMITKNDAKLYLMLSDRKVLEEKISVEDAKKKGIEFLKNIGITDVEDTYYLKHEGMVIINYAGKQDDIILYPDLIKVKIALDTGDVLSVEAQGYIFNHTKREDIKPSITLEEARKVINENVEIKKEGMAIIPTDSKMEVLTYEFRGILDEREFLVYINAKTGIEEKILIIIDTLGGTLTM